MFLSISRSLRCVQARVPRETVGFHMEFCVSMTRLAANAVASTQRSFSEEELCFKVHKTIKSVPWESVNVRV